MVPPLPCSAFPGWRFPRPRGDGPHGRRSYPAQREVSPPTRGWSPFRRDRHRSIRGSPAHAGMVPLTARSPPAPPGFPRPRGDGPEWRNQNTSAKMVPPPTRGWSPIKGRRRLCSAGSPAHAGMVPGCSAAPSSDRRFPRPRGDGPAMTAPADCQKLVPPPTRGWSLRR